MKTIINYLVLYGLIGTIAFSCKDEGNKIIPEDRLFEVHNSTQFGCKSEIDNVEANEYIELQTVDSNYLKIGHSNVSFTCFPSIVKEAKIINGVIIYSEVDTSGMSNCLCLYDITSTIGPLDYTQYTFELHRAGDKIAEFGFSFNKSTLEIFKIEKENYYDNK